MVTAGGIFLGIAFLATVLTQWLMQWPVAPKVDAGYVQVDGQVHGPGFQEVYKPVPLKDGEDAGIPTAVIEKSKLPDGKTFSLTTIVQGQLQEARAKKNLARVNKEWDGLKKFQTDLPVYVAILGGQDIKIDDAVKAGVPEKVAKKLAGKNPTFKGADMVDLLREQPKWIKPIYYATALDQDISLGDANRWGIPRAIALHLAGSGSAFKGSALNDAITAHPTWIAIWKSRVNRYSVFTTATSDSLKKLADKCSIKLDEAMVGAKDADAKNADLGNVMIVNQNGRKLHLNLAKDAKLAAATPLTTGDYIFVPDRNSYYRMWWLVGMSLLVCMVGITNSMLMAVTERFKEIGTMKCLGALDSFVVTLLVMESGMLGICASVLGWILGFGAMVLVAGMSKGWDMVATMNPLLVLGSLGICILAGMTLTLVATIMPAMQAAKMPAAMALRSEI